MFRTRFGKQIVAEFLPPARFATKQKIIILCDGMPGIPRKQQLVEFLSAKGFWVIYPRYRGAWESGGEFLKESPEKDIAIILDALPKGFTETAFGKKFKLVPDELYIIGGSFGGTVSILCSLDDRVKKVVANCPVVDWKILPSEQKKETSEIKYSDYIRSAFGNGYRLSQKNWNKLFSGKFFNPSYHSDEFDASKVLMFHAKDDPFVPWRDVKRFSDRTGIELVLLTKGGHLRTEFVVTKYWDRISRFFARSDR